MRGYIVCFVNIFSLTPNECVFIDDSPANIESAARVGLNGIVFYSDVALLGAIN